MFLRLPQTADYALRAVCYIAEHEAKGPVAGPAVAAALGVPANYLSKLLHELGQRGLLASVRGVQGGYLLGLAPQQLHLSAIVQPFMREREHRCIMGHQRCVDQGTGEVPSGQQCGAHARWKEVREVEKAFFSDLTMADLLGPAANRDERISNFRHPHVHTPLS